MRRLLIALAISLLPSFAFAAHGGGGHGGGGHMGGGGGGHIGSAGVTGSHMGGGWGGRGAWSGHASAAMAGGSMSGWRGRGVNWNHAAFSHGRFAHRHHRFFFAGGPFIAGYGYYGYDCWRWAPTPWGLRRVWVCDYYGDYY